MKSAQLLLAMTAILLVLLIVRFWSIEPIFDLLPDSAEYLHGAYSVWSGKGFREISRIDEPLIRGRQPGTAWFLAPVVGLIGFDLTIAKSSLIIAIALAILFASYFVWLSTKTTTTTLIFFACHAINAFSILCSCQLISESIYVLGMMVLCLLLLSPEPSASLLMLKWFALGTLLTFIARTRIQGILLLPSVIMWILLACQFRMKSAAVRLLPFLAGVVALWFLTLGPVGAFEDYLSMAQQNQAKVASFTQRFEQIQGNALRYLESISFIMNPFGLMLDLHPTLHDYFSTTTRSITGRLFGIIVLMVGIIGGVDLYRNSKSYARAWIIAFVLHAVLLQIVLILWPYMLRLAFPIAFLFSIAFAVSIMRLPIRVRQLIYIVTLISHLLALIAYLHMFTISIARPLEDEAKWLARNTNVYDRVLTNEDTLFLTTGRWQHSYVLTAFNGEPSYRLAADSILQLRFRYLAFDGNADPMLARNPAFSLEQIELEPGKPGRLFRIVLNKTGTVSPLPKVEVNSDTEKARRELEEKVRKASFHGAERAGAYLQLAKFEIEQREFSRAESAIRQVATGASFDLFQSEVQLNLKLLAALKAVDDPRTSLTDKLNILIGLGDASLDVAQWEQALGYYERAAALSPNDPAIILQQAYPLRVLGLIDRHRQLLRDVQSRLATVDRRKLQNTSIFSMFTREVLITQVIPEIIANRSVTLSMLGDELSFDSKLVDDYLRLSAFASKHYLPGLAEHLLEQAVARFPANAAVLSQLAGLRLACGRSEEAKSLLEDAIKIDQAPDLVKLLDIVTQHMSVIPTHPNNK